MPERTNKLSGSLADRHENEITKKPESRSKSISIPGLSLLYTLKDHTDTLKEMAWSHDGRLLASGTVDGTIYLWNSAMGSLSHTLASRINSLAWSPDSQLLASGTLDGTVELWNPRNGTLLYTLEGHNAPTKVAWSPNGSLLASCSSDRTIRFWNPKDGKPICMLRHPHLITVIVWSPNSRLLASGSNDGTIRIWDPLSGKLQYTFRGHTNQIRSIAWFSDGQFLASCSNDNTVRLWHLEETEHKTFVGHSDIVNDIAWSPDGKQLVSCSDDKTVGLWNAETGVRIHTLEGFTQAVWKVSWSPDGKLLLTETKKIFAGSYLSEIYFWRLDTRESIAVISDLLGNLTSTWHPRAPILATIGQQDSSIALWKLDMKSLLKAIPSSETAHYTNAKVVLIGDSGVGKSGLGLVLSGQPYAPTESTHGRRVWTFDRQEVILVSQSIETREILLWDLAGQPGYRLIHQLSLHEVTVALVVFDSQNETDPFAGIRHWERALRQAQRTQGSSTLPLKKLLVAARRDRGGIVVSSERVQMILNELGFESYFETSAKEGWQISELKTTIRDAIDWEALPRVSSTILFQQIKGFLVEEKQRAKRLLSTRDDLYSLFLNCKGALEPDPMQRLLWGITGKRDL